MLALFVALLIVVIGAALYFMLRNHPARLLTTAASAFLALALVLWSVLIVVPASHVGVLVTFGKVDTSTLPEGLHFVAPWASVHHVFTGMDVATAQKSEAGSKDLQSVHADLTVNYHPDASKVRDLYLLNPSLSYEAAFVVPATYEVFKAVVSRYTAEELVTKRQEVSAAITTALNAKLAPYFLTVQSINLVNFGFSRAFDAAIEEKVTASQKAATAQRNLERVKYEAEARIAQAEGEARAISIQAAAIEKQGGAAYTQLKAIEKWDGKLPAYVTGGATVPFVQVK